MAPAANVAFLVLCASGVYLIAGRSWTFPYQANILLHPLAGLLACLLLLRYVPGHLSQKLPGRESRASGRRIVLAAALIAASAAVVVYPIASVLLLPAAAALVVAQYVRLVRLAEPLPRPKASMLAPSALLLFLFAATWLTGIPLLAVPDHPPDRWVIRAHRFFGWAAALAFLAHVLPAAVRTVRRRPSPAPADRRTLRWLGASAVALAVLGATTAAWEVVSEARLPSYSARLSTIEKDDALPAGQKLLAGRERELLALTDACGRGKGCHESLVKDFARSAHLASVRTTHFAKNMDLMSEEIGRSKTLLCAGCHVPVDTLAGNTAFTLPDPAHRGNSCAFCHSLYDAWVDPTDKRRSFYTVRPRYAHLALVDEADAEKTGPRARFYRTLLRLNIAGHGRTLMRPFYRQDRFCDACHHLQTPAPPPGRFVNPRCADCHMQSERYLRAEGRAANHYFPGSNTALPYILGDTRTLEDVLRWLNGELPLPLKGWGAFWQLRGRTEGDPTLSVWLRMAAEILPPAGPGAGPRLRITTANVGMAHRFPAAALDLLEVWQQVEVEDEKGEVIFVRGRLDANQDLDPEAHELGGYMLDPQGHMIDRNRVWRLDKKVIERAIEANGQVVDDYDLPLRTGAGEIRVRAWWNYRFMNRHFTEWAYGEEFELPVAKIGDLDVHFRFAVPRGSEKPAAASDDVGNTQRRKAG